MNLRMTECGTDYTLDLPPIGVTPAFDGMYGYWEDQSGLHPDLGDGLHGATADPDGDGLSNLQEYQMATSPVRPNSSDDIDANKRLTAAASFVNTGKAYDVYYRQDSVSKWRRLSSGVPSQKYFTFVKPNPLLEGDYVFLEAGDGDGDGLSNGYEDWFTYNGQRTAAADFDSDFDGMYDGWEVQYGLDPKSTTFPDGGGHNPDGDNLTNLQEHQSYGFAAKAYNASYDPVKNITSEASRPLITLSHSGASAFNLGSFTLTRHAKAGDPNPYLGNLIVYCGLGGNLVYGSDYTLLASQGSTITLQGGLFAVTIPAGQSSATVTVAVTPGAAPASNLTVALVPFRTVN